MLDVFGHSRTASEIRHGAVEWDLGARMEVLLQEGTGCEVPGSATEGDGLGDETTDTGPRVKYWRLEEEEEGEKEGELAVLLQAGPGDGGEQTPAPQKQVKRLETLQRDRSN
eukprot:superscaffoldBa00000207_g2714